MSQLAKLQHRFQQCVLGSTNTDDNAWISAGGRADPETQLSIYSYAYAARLKEVLATDYPALLVALGDELFNPLADDYIETHPSHYFSLRDFGRHLPDFITELIQNNANYKNMHWLHELAMFEWTLTEAFDAADATLFTEQDMANLAPEVWPDLKFTLHPSVHRLDFKWNTTEVWQTLTADDPKKITAEREPTSAWIIWRDQLTTRFRSMQSNEQQAFNTLRGGGNFNDICEALATMMEVETVPLHAATLLKGWITQGLITGLDKPVQI